MSSSHIRRLDKKKQSLQVTIPHSTASREETTKAVHSKVPTTNCVISTAAKPCGLACTKEMHVPEFTTTLLQMHAGSQTLSSLRSSPTKGRHTSACAVGALRRDLGHLRPELRCILRGFLLTTGQQRRMESHMTKMALHVVKSSAPPSSTPVNRSTAPPPPPSSSW